MPTERAPILPVLRWWPFNLETEVEPEQPRDVDVGRANELEGEMERLKQACSLLQEKVTGLQKATKSQADEVAAATAAPQEKGEVMRLCHRRRPHQQGEAPGGRNVGRGYPRGDREHAGPDPGPDMVRRLEAVKLCPQLSDLEAKQAEADALQDEVERLTSELGVVQAEVSELKELTAFEPYDTRSWSPGWWSGRQRRSNGLRWLLWRPNRGRSIVSGASWTKSRRSARWPRARSRPCKR